MIRRIKILFLLCVLSLQIVKAQVILINPYIYVTTCDIDANNFLASSGISDPTTVTAVCQWFSIVKAEPGAYSGLVAAYLMVGGTATSCKWNAVNPVNSDGAYRLTFYGGWTFSSTGALPNATDTYADTHLAINTLPLSTGGFSYYSRTSSTATGSMMGVNVNNRSYIRRTGSTNVYGNYKVDDIVAIGSTSAADFCSSRTGNNINPFYIDGLIESGGSNTSSNDLDNKNIYLGAENQGSAGNFSDLECAGAAIFSSGYTAAQVLALHNAFQTMNTILNRQNN